MLLIRAGTAFDFVLSALFSLALHLFKFSHRKPDLFSIRAAVVKPLAFFPVFHDASSRVVR